MATWLICVCIIWAFVMGLCIGQHIHKLTSWHGKLKRDLDREYLMQRAIKSDERIKELEKELEDSIVVTHREKPSADEYKWVMNLRSKIWHRLAGKGYGNLRKTLCGAEVDKPVLDIAWNWMEDPGSHVCPRCRELMEENDG